MRAIYAVTMDAYRLRPEVDWSRLCSWSEIFVDIGVTDLKAGTDADWAAWIDVAVTDLIDRRKQLPVADLAASIRGFGAGNMH